MREKSKPDIFLIQVENCQSAWIADVNTVAKLLAQMFSSHGYQVNSIATLDALDSLIRSRRRNIVVINCHGEAIPIPNSWSEDWYSYLAKIGVQVRDSGWTFTSVTGYPFFYLARPDALPTPIEPTDRRNGLGSFISGVNGEVQGAFPINCNLTIEGSIAVGRVDKFVPPPSISVSRSFFWQNLQAEKIYYAAGGIYGAASIRIGAGFFVYNGMLAEDFGTSINQYSDSLIANFAFVFTLHTISRVRIGEQLLYPEKVLRDLASDLNKHLSSMVGWERIDEKKVQEEIMKILKLKYEDSDFRKERNYFPYSIKSYKPDFTSKKLNMAIDVKICKSKNAAKRIVSEINDDIVAYKTAFSSLLFIVYDTDKYIPDRLEFTRDFEEHNPGVRIFIV